MLDCIGNDVIDTRDLIEEWEELDSERDELVNEISEIQEAIEESGNDEDLNEDDIKELKDKLDAKQDELSNWEEENDYDKIKEFIEECEGYCSDFRYGGTLIEVDYFTQYAEQLAEDLGYIDRNVTWPCNHIDWDEAAEELKQDYTELSEIGGWTYLVR